MKIVEGEGTREVKEVGRELKDWNFNEECEEGDVVKREKERKLVSC